MNERQNAGPRQHRQPASRHWVLVPLMLLALLGGCASGPRVVRTDVTSFDEWATLPAERSYTFARTLEFRNSLELKSYEDIVRDELALQGFRLASNDAAANLVVTLRPSVTTTRMQVRDPWPVDPFWSPYGFYGRRGFGWYDPYGSMFNDFNVDVYHRRLELDIDSRTTAGKRYYEGRVESAGQTSALQTVMPALVRALFMDFPGSSGQTRRVDVPLPSK